MHPHDIPRGGDYFDAARGRHFVKTLLDVRIAQPRTERGEVVEMFRP